MAQSWALLEQTPTQHVKANIDVEEEREDNDIADNVNDDNDDLLHVRLAALTSAGMYTVSLPPQVMWALKHPVKVRSGCHRGPDCITRSLRFSKNTF